MSALLELAERLEAYDPKMSLDNRGDEMPLDLAIAKAIGLAGDDWQVARGSVTGYFSGDGVDGFGNPAVPRYIASLDAAMTLVPEGWLLGSLYDQFHTRKWHASIAQLPSDEQLRAFDAGRTFGVECEHGEAATAALALCAAALRARAA